MTGMVQLQQRSNTTNRDGNAAWGNERICGVHQGLLTSRVSGTNHRYVLCEALCMVTIFQVPLLRQIQHPFVDAKRTTKNIVQYRSNFVIKRTAKD